MTTFYLPSITGRPIQYFFDRGWKVCYAGQFWGICIIKYMK